MSQACIMAGIEGQRPFLRREAPPDDRGTQGQGKREGYSWQKTPLEWRVELDKIFGSKYEGEVIHLNDNRSETTLRAYRLTYVREGFWPRAGALANAESLNYHATQAGYRLWGSPVLVDQAGQQEETGKATSDFWLYFEEIPGIDVTLKRGEVKSPTFRSRRDNPIQRDSYEFPFDKGKPLHELVYEQVLSKEAAQKVREAPLEGRYQASGKAGAEKERPQYKEGGQPQRAFMGGERYERSEKHYGGIATSERRLKNGQPRDIGHLYTEREQDGQLIWWTERQSIASWQDEVRAAHERGDLRYENIPEDKIPASITHSRASIYEGGGKRPYAGNNYAFIEYISSADQHDSTNTIQVLNEPVTTAGSRIDTGKGAEPKRDRSSEGEEQDVFTAGREKNDLHENAQQRRTEAYSENESYQHPGQEEQRNRRSYGDASTAGAKDASSQEQGELAQARAVLQAIVNAHEDTIDETTPLDRIAGLTTEQVRVAERRVAQKIISDARARRINYGVVIKETPQGLLGLVHGGQLAKSEEMALHLNKGGSLVMINTYALDQPREGMERNYGFEDYRLGWKGANLGSLALRSEKGRQLDDIRFMWRGLRWMSANMLAWDNPNTIMPEDLDSKSW